MCRGACPQTSMGMVATCARVVRYVFGLCRDPACLASTTGTEYSFRIASVAPSRAQVSGCVCVIRMFSLYRFGAGVCAGDMQIRTHGPAERDPLQRRHHCHQPGTACAHRLRFGLGCVQRCRAVVVCFGCPSHFWGERAPSMKKACRFAYPHLPPNLCNALSAKCCRL